MAEDGAAALPLVDFGLYGLQLLFVNQALFAVKFKMLFRWALRSAYSLSCQSHRLCLYSYSSDVYYFAPPAISSMLGTCVEGCRALSPPVVYRVRRYYFVFRVFIIFGTLVCSNFLFTTPNGGLAAELFCIPLFRYDLLLNGWLILPPSLYTSWMEWCIMHIHTIRTRVLVSRACRVCLSACLCVLTALLSAVTAVERVKKSIFCRNGDRPQPREEGVDNPMQARIPPPARGRP